MVLVLAIYICAMETDNSLPFLELSLEEIRRLNSSQWIELAQQIKIWLKKGKFGKEGHLNSSLGVVELTLALHLVYKTPYDIIIWDVGHQSYVHKALTGRAKFMDKMRQLNGISGFPNRTESVYDAFGTGHSATSISAIGGMALADKILGVQRKYVAVIGDGAITGGQAFEALNHLGSLDLDILLVFNDNGRSLDDNVGALHLHQSYSTYFSSLGWNYNGPVDGHDLNLLIELLQHERRTLGKRVLHIKTTHPGLKISTINAPKQSGEMGFGEVFGGQLLEWAKVHNHFAVISPAMTESAFLSAFADKFPNRFFDVGIAEQHAAGLAAGLAAHNLTVFLHLYSTFSQRAIDQIIHDIALQNLPVKLFIDRAGITGEDGATHQGAFDLALMHGIPNLEIWDVVNGNQLAAAIQYALENNGPIAVRFPRGKTLFNPNDKTPLFQQKTVITQDSNMGWMVLGHSMEHFITAGLEMLPHILIQRLKPLDENECLSFMKKFEKIAVLEDASIKGGLYASVCEINSRYNLGKKIHAFSLPDTFIPHGKPEQLREILGLGNRALGEFAGI